jgi:hypothetical protein
MGGARERERKGWNPVVSRSKRATPATTTTVQIRLGYIMDERERESSFRATSKTRIFFFFFFSKVTLFILHKFFCQGEMEKNGRISPPVCAVVERKKKTDARDFFAGFLIRLCVCTTIFCVFERERSTCLFLGCPSADDESIVAATTRSLRTTNPRETGVCCLDLSRSFNGRRLFFFKK